jgi:transposase
VARSSAVKARTQTTNPLKALLVSGPAGLREQVRHLTSRALIARCARLRLTNQLSEWIAKEELRGPEP